MPAVMKHHGRRIVPINAVILVVMESQASLWPKLPQPSMAPLYTKTVDNTVQERCIVIDRYHDSLPRHGVVIFSSSGVFDAP